MHYLFPTHFGFSTPIRNHLYTVFCQLLSLSGHGALCSLKVPHMYLYI